MRALIAKEKGDSNPWDLKLAAGGLLDIEFVAQYLTLRYASAHPAHALSRHIGSTPPFRLVGVVGKHTQSLVPARSCFISPPGVEGKSMIVALAETDGGTALIALAIFC